MDHLNLRDDRQRRQLGAKQSFDEMEMFQWLMREEIGRKFVWRLIEKSSVLARTLADSTATVQAAKVGVRDFVMQQVLHPVLTHCPRLFLEMQQENESDVGHAAKTN